MEKFIPYEKLSKKAKRALDARKRGSWGGLNPVTRRPANPKAYDRNKAKRRKYDDSDSSPCVIMLCLDAQEACVLKPVLPDASPEEDASPEGAGASAGAGEAAVMASVQGAA